MNTQISVSNRYYEAQMGPIVLLRARWFKVAVNHISANIHLARLSKLTRVAVKIETFVSALPFVMRHVMLAIALNGSALAMLSFLN
jgi:hypothetical protein